MIEMAGVLGVILLLVASMAPPVIRQFDESAREKEKQTMADIADGLRQHILANRSIPSLTNFYDVAGSVMGRSPSMVHTNDRGRDRRLLIDPDFRVGTGTGSLPPYSQTHLGSIRPQKARFILITSLGTPLPVDLPEGVIPWNLFSNIWVSLDDRLPTGWNNWNGERDDLIIQRINLEPLFEAVMLATSPGQEIGQFSVDGGVNILPVPGTTDPRNHVAFYVRGTVLDLYDEQTAANKQYTEIVQESASFIFENRVWKTKLMATGSLLEHRTPEDLELAFQEFMSRTNIPTGSDLQTHSRSNICYLLTNYMNEYVRWAEGSGSKSAAGSAASAIDCELKNIQKN
jgi:hypothetical protein